MAGTKKKSVGATILTVIVAIVVILLRDGNGEQAVDQPQVRSGGAVVESSPQLDGDGRGSPSAVAVSEAEEGESVVAEAFAAERSDDQMTIRARVSRVLPDDNEGSRHQRFIVRFEGSGRTVLISHNIDLAERAPVEEGDWVRVHGEYEWSDRGGVIHWTHHNPARNPIHPGGWVEHDGVRYE